jgi:hypothetical protein
MHIGQTYTAISAATLPVVLGRRVSADERRRGIIVPGLDLEILLVLVLLISLIGN